MDSRLDGDTALDVSQMSLTPEEFAAATGLLNPGNWPPPASRRAGVEPWREWQRDPEVEGEARGFWQLFL